MPLDVRARPNPDEYDAYYATYIALVPAGDLLAILRAQVADVDAAFGAKAARYAHASYAPDKWTLSEVLGHLIDSERVFTYRALAFARGEAAPLPSFDQAAWCPYGQFNERSFDSLLEEWRAVRAHTISLVAGLPADSLPRRGVASGNALSVQAALAIATGHVAYHLKLLRERYV